MTGRHPQRGTLTRPDAIVGNHALGVGGGCPRAAPRSRSPVHGLRQPGLDRRRRERRTGPDHDEQHDQRQRRRGPGSIMGTAGGISGGLGSTVSVKSSTVTANHPSPARALAAGSRRRRRPCRTRSSPRTSRTPPTRAPPRSTTARRRRPRREQPLDSSDCGFTQSGDHQGVPVSLGPSPTTAGRPIPARSSPEARRSTRAQVVPPRTSAALPDPAARPATSARTSSPRPPRRRRRWR